MEEIIKLDSVDDYNKIRGVETLHPLITVVDLSKAKPMPAQTFNFGFYAVYLKEPKCGELRYGRNNYDYQEETLVLVAPGAGSEYTTECKNI
jgi:AraC family transcriptional regulator, transcriptional activator of pobA